MLESGITGCLSAFRLAFLEVDCIVTEVDASGSKDVELGNGSMTTSLNGFRVVTSSELLDDDVEDVRVTTSTLRTDASSAFFKIGFNVSS